MNAIDSPCTKICVVDAERGLCRGCHRTLAEISCWVNYSRAERLAVLEKVAQRKAAVSAREFK
ncbi:MAG: DUF1289 domain-containing protein [Betaproteobacteria bacterium]|nr:DUF1289 domain-containing protein [Betaproteobacteria bacterium]